MDMGLDQLIYCIIQTYLFANMQLCSIYFIVLLTFERFYSIIRPHKAASFNTVKRAKITIACIVVYGIVGNIPHLFTTELEGRICLSIFNNTPKRVFYWYGSITTFMIPFVLLLIINCIIIFTLRRRAKSSLTRSTDQGQTQGQDKSFENQIYMTLLLVTFTFLILTTPIMSVIFWQTFNFQPTPKMIAIHYLWFTIGETFIFTNNAINFFLYVMSGKKFRTDLKNLFTRSKGPNSNAQCKRVSEVQTASSVIGSEQNCV